MKPMAEIAALAGVLLSASGTTAESPALSMRPAWLRQSNGAFIAASLENLIRMAGKHEGLGMLGYLMEMARVE